jgi:branched-chain amino acid transport system ATP-binding protein
MTASDPVSQGAPHLRVTDLEVAYGVARALFGVSLEVAKGSVTTVLGANGAGKSSLAAAIGGAVKPRSGSIEFEGRDITGLAAHRACKLGIAYVPENRNLFPHLSVRDNLWAQLRFTVPRAQRNEALDRALTLFPILAQRRKQNAGTLSGGEQQMLALARVLAAPPKLLIADEMSLGLAPMMVDLVFESLAKVRDQGVTVLLIEQFVDRALAFADQAVILRHGVVAWHGNASDAGDELLSEYLGGERPASLAEGGPSEDLTATAPAAESQ